MHNLAVMLPHKTLVPLIFLCGTYSLYYVWTLIINYDKPKLPERQMMFFPLSVADDFWSQPLQKQMYSSCYPAGI